MNEVEVPKPTNRIVVASPNTGVNFLVKVITGHNSTTPLGAAGTFDRFVNERFNACQVLLCEQTWQRRKSKANPENRNVKSGGQEDGAE